MSDLHRHAHVKTHKDHRCAYCNSVIPKGTAALKEHGICDHEFYARYACGECEPHLDGFWRWCRGECENPLDESFAYYRELEGAGE